MVLKDFETGGFIVSTVVPVLCFLKGDKKLLVAYSNDFLSKIIQENYDNIELCVGVWPGKSHSDCFLLSKDHYKS